jgi:hypothetical protein
MPIIVGRLDNLEPFTDHLDELVPSSAPRSSMARRARRTTSASTNSDGPWTTSARALASDHDCIPF